MHLTPEEKEEMRQLADKAARLIYDQSAHLLNFTLGCVERGAGTTQLLAVRSPIVPEMAAFVIVASGRYTDGDIANIRNHFMGAQQDANAGVATRTLLNMDTLSKEGGE